MEKIKKFNEQIEKPVYTKDELIRRAIDFIKENVSISYVNDINDATLIKLTAYEVAELMIDYHNYLQK